MTDEYKAQESEKTEPITDESTFLCVETETGYIHEAKAFDGYVIVRPISPQLYGLITRVSDEEFSEKFEEFLGDFKEVMKYVNGE